MTFGCKLCGKLLAYPGAVFCGSACCAEWEGGKRPALAMPADAGLLPNCDIEQRGNDWIAIPRGKSSPILRPVPGNTRPSQAARWPSRDEAVTELTAWGWTPSHKAGEQ